MRTYLDHNATSPMRPAARRALEAALDAPGNASSVHAEGRAAKTLIENARKTIADALGVLPQMVVFTGTGSEANNQALKGADVDNLIVSAIEHPCIIEAANASGKNVEIAPVDDQGAVKLDALKDILGRLGDTRSLIAVMLANNETGVLQPVAEVAALAGQYGALMHTDAIQAMGKIPVNFTLLGADSLSLSAHKVGGPQGVGALVLRDGLVLEKHIHGGGQELGRRAGTENVAGIAAFAAAVKDASETLDSFTSKIRSLRDQLESELQAGNAQTVVFSSKAQRLPNTTCLALPGLDAQTALMNLDLDGVAVSSGSACSSGKVAASKVLAAMGVSDDLARCAIRISLGWSTTEADIAHFIQSWQRLAARHASTQAA